MALEGGGGRRKPKPRPPDDIYDRRTPTLPLPTPQPPDDIYERRTPTFPPPREREPLKVPESPRPASGGGWCGSEEWVRAFVKAHGRAPTGRDLEDCRWSERFLREHGRPPTEEDWRARWYGQYGGGGAGEEEEEEFWPKAGELLQKLSFPMAEQLPVFLREWTRYLQDLLAQNPERAIPLPFAPTEEGEEADTVWRQTLTEVAQQLGLSHLMEERPEDPVVAYQEFLNALAQAPLSAQQILIGLRYTPEAGWHRVQTPLLPHPAHL